VREAHCRMPSPEFREALWMVRNPTLLSDAESAEDQVQDVVGGGGAGDFVERAQGRIKIEQEHLVWHAGGPGVGRGGEPGEQLP